MSYPFGVVQLDPIAHGELGYVPAGPHANGAAA